MADVLPFVVPGRSPEAVRRRWLVVAAVAVFFIAYAPVISPRYAAACVVEHGGGGSRAAAPVVRDVMTEVLLRDPALKTALLASNEAASGAPKEKATTNCALAISVKDHKDEVRLSAAIGRLVEEDAGLDWAPDELTQELLIRAGTDEAWLRIEVDDDGPGIPPAERDNVFRPFYRPDHARNQYASNTGLGPAIAGDIARSHGGDIALGTSAMGGLRATMRVPL